MIWNSNRDKHLQAIWKLYVFTHDWWTMDFVVGTARMKNLIFFPRNSTVLTNRLSWCGQNYQNLLFFSTFFQKFKVNLFFTAWIKAELLLSSSESVIRSSSLEKICQVFYSNLRDMDYGSQFLLAEFAKVIWTDANKDSLQKYYLWAPSTEDVYGQLRMHLVYPRSSKRAHWT